MKRPLEGRGAAVTGGGRGIGAAIAHALAGAGAAVVVASRTASEIERIATELRSHGARATAVQCDVTSEASVRAMGEAARRALGSVDILINNAGLARSAPLAKITLEEWNASLAVNATGAFLCTRELASAMAARGWGRIVNIASIAGLEGAKYIAAYAAAKHAVVGFTRAVATELAESGVCVNALCPGYVDTAATDRAVDDVRARSGLSPDRALAAVLATTGQERLITPEEVAAEVLRLCLDESGVTGEAIPIGVGARAS